MRGMVVGVAMSAEFAVAPSTAFGGPLRRFAGEEPEAGVDLGTSLLKPSDRWKPYAPDWVEGGP